MNVYSAHDYTVLSVLSNLRVLPKYEDMVVFGCTVTIEVWSSQPPEHPSGPARITSPGGTGEEKIIRILCNNNPFNDTHVNKDLTLPPLHLTPTLEVQDRNEVCLADLSEEHVRAMMVDIKEGYANLAETAEVVQSAKKVDQDTE